MQQPPNDQPEWQQPSGPNWPPQQPGQPLPPYSQYPQYPYQQPPQHTQYPPQYPQQPPPQWQQPGMPPQYPMPPQQPPRKSGRLWVILLIIVILSCVGASFAAHSGNNTTTTDNTTTTPTDPQIALTNSAQLVATNAAAPTDVPTATPVPTLSSAQTEAVYKKSTTNTTVDNLDKNGNAFKGKEVHFTCKILKFVKDDSGNTAGANVESPDTYSSSIVQVEFPSGTDITRLNEGDIVEVWGSDAGVFSGQNAFGGTVYEVGIAGLYLNDQTTHYQTH